jgi:hypothetical protein
MTFDLDAISAVLRGRQDFSKFIQVAIVALQNLVRVELEEDIQCNGLLASSSAGRSSLRLGWADAARPYIGGRLPKERLGQILFRIIAAPSKICELPSFLGLQTARGYYGQRQAYAK